MVVAEKNRRREENLKSKSVHCCDSGTSMEKTAATASETVGSSHLTVSQHASVLSNTPRIRFVLVCEEATIRQSLFDALLEPVL